MDLVGEVAKRRTVGEMRKVLSNACTTVLVAMALTACGSGGTNGSVNGYETTAYTSPAFSEGAKNYNVWCEASPCEVSVSVEGGPEASVEDASNTERKLRVNKGRIVTRLAAGDVLRVGGYTWRVMPSDFPHLEVEGAREAGVWTLVGLFRTRDTVVSEEQRAVGEFVAALDEHGAVVWFERADAPMNVTWAGEARVAWFEDTQRQGVNYSSDAVFRIHDLETNETSELPMLVDGYKMDFHELERHDDSWWVIGAKKVEKEPGYDAPVIVDAVIRIPDGGTPVVVWEHTSQLDPSETDKRVLGDTERIVEPVHLNSIQVTSDGILISSREMSEVQMFDPETGKALWRMRGQSVAMMKAGTYQTVALDDGAKFCNQHDARMWGDGTLSLFDNQSCTQQKARASVYRLENGTAHLVWSRMSGESSSSVGSLRKTARGWLVSWGSAHAPLAEEIDENGKSLFSVRADGSVMTYRAVDASSSKLSVGARKRQ